MATSSNFWADGGHVGGPSNKQSQAVRPAMHYKAPKLYRGSIISDRVDAQGNPANYNYGTNQSALPSSVGTLESDRLAAIQGTNPDPLRDKIVANGSARDGSNVDPQQVRTLEARNVPIHAYQNTRGRVGGVEQATRGKALPARIGNSVEQPVRKPA